MFSTGRKKFNASNDILTNDVPSSSDEKKESTFKVNCFNCDGEHSFQDCELPLDHQRIAANRAVHFNNKRVTQERYTSAGEIGSNSSLKLRPGEISDTLREALGIGRSDIPEWIYRMRRRGFIDGYPPGYLAEGQTSKLRSSTLAVDKIIAYPGFNYYNRNLNDCECFRVPRFTEYIKYLQEYVGAIYMVNIFLHSCVFKRN
ncbi:unnamed protein product [Thelazia callipaeda]|uniref:PSP domain-containing protein n=1 Tax=Thelazia callipaeda TaxID=103827 RepID=A0A0N5CVI4_THECL|nr:unnamed protein product [Thelazia callipaeda]